MHDAARVRRLDDLGDALEKRNELREGHRPLRLQPLAERDALDELHRDPAHAVLFDAERVDVRGVRVIEPRGQPRLAHEPLRRSILAPP